MRWHYSRQKSEPRRAGLRVSRLCTQINHSLAFEFIWESLSWILCFLFPFTQRENTLYQGLRAMRPGSIFNHTDATLTVDTRAQWLVFKGRSRPSCFISVLPGAQPLPRHHALHHRVYTGPQLNQVNVKCDSQRLCWVPLALNTLCKFRPPGPPTFGRWFCLHQATELLQVFGTGMDVSHGNASTFGCRPSHEGRKDTWEGSQGCSPHPCLPAWKWKLLS